MLGVVAFKSFMGSNLLQFPISFISYFDVTKDSSLQFKEEEVVAFSADFFMSVMVTSVEVVVVTVEEGSIVAVDVRFVLSFKIIINVVIRVFTAIVG